VRAAPSERANAVDLNGDSCFHSHRLGLFLQQSHNNRELAHSSPVASDDDAPQTPRDATPKTELEDGMTWMDNQFEEELEARSDRITTTQKRTRRR
jgi:hypothetical protein